MIGVWYFSGTGKCKQVATQIVTSLSPADVEVKDITPLSYRKVINKSISYDKLILVFPVYAGDVPNTLKEFLNELNGNGVATILIALWGNVHSGEALLNANRILTERKFHIVAGAEMLAEHSFNFGDIRLAKGRPTEHELQELILFIKRNILKTSPIIDFPTQKSSFLISCLMKLPQSFIPRKVIKIHTDNEKCVHCGICQKICPVNAITNEVTIDNKSCIRCLSCETSCPTKAKTHTFTTKLGIKFFARNQYFNYDNQFYESPL